MRLLLDSSVLVTYVASPNRDRSAVFAMLRAAAFLDVSLVWSDHIEHEVRLALLRKPAFARLAATERIERTLEDLDAALDRIPVVLGPHDRVCRDPDDDAIVAAAVAGACDAVVTLDRDLLDLVEHRGIRFLKPGGALDLLRETGSSPWE